MRRPPRDARLGLVRVRRMLGVFDAGRIINPRLADSQAHGGMIGGISQALLEHTDGTQPVRRISRTWSATSAVRPPGPVATQLGAGRGERGPASIEVRLPRWW